MIWTSRDLSEKNFKIRSLTERKLKNIMDMNKAIESLKAHPDYARMGMIASHLGVVRGTSLNGRKVTGIDVRFDREAVNRIIEEARDMPGIIAVVVETFEGRLCVGDDIMAVIVGGDTREHVFPALVTTVDRIKTAGTKKKEFF